MVQTIREKLEELDDSAGIKVIHKSRDGRKGAGGGVAFAFNMSTCNFKARHLANGNKDQEIICAVGRITKIKRQVVVFIFYIPPLWPRSLPSRTHWSARLRRSRRQ